MTAVLQVTDLEKSYGARAAVRKVTFAVERGEIFGLLGPNGAGKSSTILATCGVLGKTGGSIVVDGIDLSARPHDAKRKLGLVPQDLAIYEQLSSVENLAYFGALWGLGGKELATQIEFGLELAGLSDRRNDPAKTFSGGMKRRLNLACGVVHKPAVLILDEPTVGIDPQSRNHIFDAVKRLAAQGLTVIYTSHYMEEVEALCNRIAIMDGGQIVAAGTIKELIAKHASGGVEIECDEAAATRLAAEDLRTQLQQHDAVIEQSGIRLKNMAALATVLGLLASHGIAVTAVNSRRANLEAVFLNLTGKALRDE